MLSDTKHVSISMQYCSLYIIYWRNITLYTYQTKQKSYFINVEQMQ